jgi:hypothetical protein
MLSAQVDSEGGVRESLQSDAELNELQSSQDEDAGGSCCAEGRSHHGGCRRSALCPRRYASLSGMPIFLPL